MTQFQIHTKETAPKGSVGTLEATQKGLGFVPNLMGSLAESPVALNAYGYLMGEFGKTSFSATEQQIVLLSTSFENECEYCMAAHTTVGQMQKVPQNILNALRDGKPIDDTRLETLRRFTALVVRNRGNLTERQITDFLSAGYSKQALLEVMVGVAMKTLSNYTNHIARIPIDSAFKANEWVKPLALNKSV